MNSYQYNPYGYYGAPAQGQAVPAVPQGQLQGQGQGQGQGQAAVPGQLQQQQGQQQQQQQVAGAGVQTAQTGATQSDYYASRGYPYPNYMYQQGQPYNGYQPVQGQVQPQQQPQPAAAVGASAVPAGLPPVATPIQDTLNSLATSSVGQLQPPGIRPRVTTTMWEDEKTLCYQVDANNVSVVRRADNNMINGTKLLNVAQMTRGRRDGILKSEKVRHVVKIGSMHLKGVWIPFERALAMAQRESIVDLLYPLFVRDIKRVIQTGVTPALGVPPIPIGGPSTAAASGGVGSSVGSGTPAGATTGATTGGASAASTGSGASAPPQLPTTTYNSKTSPIYSNQPDYSQYSQINGNAHQSPHNDPKSQQLYGYQNQGPAQASQAPPVPTQGQPGQQPAYSTQQYPYYNQYNQYSGQQMYQNYGYQVPPSLHQQPAPVATPQEQSETKKED